MLKQKSSATDHPARNEERIPVKDQLFWLCPVVGLIAGASLLWLFGLTLWTAIGLVLLIVCPVIVLWALASVSRGNSTKAKSPH